MKAKKDEPELLWDNSMRIGFGVLPPRSISYEGDRKAEEISKSAARPAVANSMRSRFEDIQRNTSGHQRRPRPSSSPAPTRGGASGGYGIN